MSYTDKIKPICRLSEIINPSTINGDLFVVSDAKNKVESLVYANNDTNNSDRVRSAFAKSNGVKFTDTRCSRLKNVNKRSLK